MSNSAYYNCCCFQSSDQTRSIARVPGYFLFENLLFAMNGNEKGSIFLRCKICCHHRPGTPICNENSGIQAIWQRRSLHLKNARYDAFATKTLRDLLTLSFDLLTLETYQVSHDEPLRQIWESWIINILVTGINLTASVPCGVDIMRSSRS